MAEIANIDLRFMRRARGVAPLSRYSVDDDGDVFASAPDEIEARTSHIVRFSQSAAVVQKTFSVETLRKLEIAGNGESWLGITDDDVYLFCEGRKSRFMSDRRVAYADISLAEDGKRFAVAYSDMMASGYSLALGEMSGRSLWTKDMPYAVTRLSVSRKGEFIAVAGATGEIDLMDSSRATVLRHRQESPLRAIATIGPARTIFATDEGVGALDSEGGLLWFTDFDAPVTEIAMDSTGETTAALLRDSDTSGRLIFLSGQGLPVWDIEFDTARPTGIALSADGKSAAVTLRDGSIAAYALHPGEGQPQESGTSLRAQAEALRNQGNARATAELLALHLRDSPADADACRALQDALQVFQAQTVAAAELSERLQDFASADERLGAFLSIAPFNLEMMHRRHELRRAWVASSMEMGQAAFVSNDLIVAETHFRAAIEADPLNQEAREALAAVLQRSTASALDQAHHHIVAGEFAAAIASLSKAGKQGASWEAVRNLLHAARIGEALSVGNALYQQRQYAAALFQFKKILRLDPAHPEALQKISYAQSFLQNTQLNDRFTRLE
jgi:tetratricopeptide (TPR) repeat protein